jgi:hypothetical protein
LAFFLSWLERLMVVSIYRGTGVRSLTSRFLYHSGRGKAVAQGHPAMSDDMSRVERLDDVIVGPGANSLQFRLLP